jgi:hypothetical protein
MGAFERAFRGRQNQVGTGGGAGIQAYLVGLGLPLASVWRESSLTR